MAPMGLPMLSRESQGCATSMVKEWERLPERKPLRERIQEMRERASEKESCYITNHQVGGLHRDSSLLESEERSLWLEQRHWKTKVKQALFF